MTLLSLRGLIGFLRVFLFWQHLLHGLLGFFDRRLRSLDDALSHRLLLSFLSHLGIPLALRFPRFRLLVSGFFWRRFLHSLLNLFGDFLCHFLSCLLRGLCSLGNGLRDLLDRFRGAF